MSLTPDFAPDAKSQWRELDFQLQERALDVIEAFLQDPPQPLTDDGVVLDGVIEGPDGRDYVFVEVFADLGRNTLTITGINRVHLDTSL